MAFILEFESIYTFIRHHLDPTSCFTESLISSFSASHSCSLPLPLSLSVYIDEVSGSDSTGTGSPTSPFQTPSGALTFLSGRPGSLFWRKPVEEGQEAPKDQDSNGYTPISGAGLKKAKKAYEAEQKKKQKAAERESQQATATEKDGGVMDEKKLEDSKKIVLEEPKGEAKKVSDRKCAGHEWFIG